jgi:hypothetical protein
VRQLFGCVVQPSPISTQFSHVLYLSEVDSVRRNGITGSAPPAAGQTSTVRREAAVVVLSARIPNVMRLFAMYVPAVTPQG